MNNINSVSVFSGEAQQTCFLKAIAVPEAKIVAAEPILAAARANKEAIFKKYL